MRSILSSILSPLASAVLDARRRSGGSGEPTFPAKAFYFNDFAGIANATKLRDLPGWAAYSSTSSTAAARDQWQMQAAALTRMNVSNDYATSPGAFLIGRDAGSANHIVKVKLVTLPNSGSRLVLVAAATMNNQCLFMECTNSSGLMQNMILQKNVAGTLTSLASIATITSELGRRLQAGDEIEMHVIGQVAHLFVNGRRITATAGVNLDAGGAFVKGSLVGVGTREGSGTVLDDFYSAGLTASLGVAATPIFWPGSILLGGRSVPLSGTYTGDVQALDYRVLNDATGVAVTPWARMTGAIISAGAWSGTPFVPLCSLATNPKVRVQIRAANDTDATTTTNATAVGIAVASYGQSNSAYRGQGSATSHAVSNAYTWSDDASSVWQGGSATTTTRSQLWAAKIAELSGIPCGVVVAGVGSASIASLVSAHWAATLAKLNGANANNFISSWLWTQGEAEAEGAAAFDATAYRANFDLLLALLRSDVAVASNIPVGICVIGKSGGAHVSGVTVGNANWSAARACLFGLTDKPGVFVATNLADATMADSLHYVPDAYVENGRRAGLSMRKALGYGGYDGRGPVITGAVRSGAVVTLNVDLNGAASIAGSGLTNYDVSVDNFASALPISSVAVAGSSIVITLAADPGAAVKVRSFYGMTYGAPVRANGTYADGTTIPAEPLYAPLLAA